MAISLVHGPGSDQKSGAIFSPDSNRRYRYVLERRWGSGPFAMFVGLNPSIADESTDDMTVKKCVGFAKRWGMGGILIGNLYAFKATDPVDLRAARRAGFDVVGPDCDVWLQTMALRSMIAVGCWGSNVMVGTRDREVRDIVGPMLCLGKTNGGYPRHPSRIAYETELVSLAT